MKLRGGSTVITAREAKIRELRDALSFLQEQIELYVKGATDENERRLYSLQQRVMFYQQQIDIETMQLDHDKRQAKKRSPQTQQPQPQRSHTHQLQQPLNNTNNDQVRFSNRERVS